MDELVSLCKRRGFIYQSSEIYGGLQGTYDFGPLGVELKNNLKRAWWESMVYENDNIHGLDSSILTNQLVMRHSGHEETFSDPMVDCKKCKSRFREDNITDNVCPSCGSNDLTESRPFNLMFKTNVGPVEDNANFAYLRPETAQSIFTNFKNILDTTSSSLPFGIAQIGKAFRNEIIARQFIFRMREFEQMEMQFFVEPGTEMEWYERWKEKRMNWHYALGLGNDSYKFHDHENLAHYANAACDIEFNFPMGFKELEGIHSRTDFDLKNHQEYSGKKLNYFDQKSGSSYIPYVVETSIGLDRLFLSVISSALKTEKLDDGSERTVLKLPFELSPVKVAVMPLNDKDGLSEKAIKISDDLKLNFNTQYDYKDSIGKRYRRQDSIGTPFCVTVDYDSLKDDSVTIRNRDSMKQERIPIQNLETHIKKFTSINNLLRKI